MGGGVDTLPLNLSTLQKFFDALIRPDTRASFVDVDLPRATSPAMTFLGQYGGEARTEGKIALHGCMAGHPLPCSPSYALSVPSFPLAI